MLPEVQTRTCSQCELCARLTHRPEMYFGISKPNAGCRHILSKESFLEYFILSCLMSLWLLDTFTDTAISSTRVNGDHKEKVLQRWEGGDSNGESYDLENDAVSCSVSQKHQQSLKAHLSWYNNIKPELCTLTLTASYWTDYSSQLNMLKQVIC